MFSCTDNENEYVDSVIENKSQQERVVKCLVDGDSLYLTEVDGLLFFEGDIVVGEANLLSRSASLTLNSEKWTDNIVYYDFDPNYTTKSIVMAAIDHWQECTHVVFLPRNGQKNYITFTSHATLNNSPMGMKGGQQRVNLAKGGHNKGTVIHEIGHALGLYHEQTRRDRDNYITIHWENIESGKDHNFEIYSNGVDLGSFDFNSIMLYGSYDFSRNNKPTMTKLDGTIFYAQRYSLSPGDIAGITQRYPLVKIFGRSDVVPILADYDGDGRVDLSGQTSDGRWFIDYIENGLDKWDWIRAGYGGKSTRPVIADYDGDGKADISEFDDDGRWFVDYSSNGFGTWDWVGYGYGDKNSHPFAVDFDGDGKADLCIHLNDGRILIDYSADGYSGWNWSGGGYGDFNSYITFADFDGDGKADIAQNTSDGRWFIDYAADGLGAWNWIRGGYGGGRTVRSIIVDYDGDGKADIGQFLDDGRWLIDYAANGFSSWDWIGTGYGDSKSLPFAADFDGDGKADLCIKTTDGHWFVDYAANGFGSWDFMVNH